MRDHRSAESMSVEGLVGLQRTLSLSRNPFERVVGALLVAGLLKQKLAALPNEALGQLIFDYVNDMPCLSPSMTILGVATDRLLGRVVEACEDEELRGQMMTRVWEWTLYVGSLKDAEQLASANPMKITAVLSLCPEQIEPRSQSIHYMRVPITDAQPISAWQFEQIMSAIEQGFQRGNLLIHCVAGYSRSPIIAAAWMHHCGYLDFDAALKEIGKLRPTIDPSPILLRSVKENLTK